MPRTSDNKILGNTALIGRCRGILLKVLLPAMLGHVVCADFRGNATVACVRNATNLVTGADWATTFTGTMCTR